MEINKNKERNSLLCLLYAVLSIVNIVPSILLIAQNPGTVQIFAAYLPHLISPVYTLVFSLLFISLVEKSTLVKKIILSLNYVLPLLALRFANKAELYKRQNIDAHHFLVACVLLAFDLALVGFTLYIAFTEKNTQEISLTRSEAVLKKWLRIITAFAFYIGWISAIAFTLIEKYAPKSSFLYESIETYTGEGTLGFVFFVLPVSSVITGALIVLFREKLSSTGKGIIFIGGLMTALTFFTARFGNAAMIIIIASDVLLIAVTLWLLLKKRQQTEVSSSE